MSFVLSHVPCFAHASWIHAVKWDTHASLEAQETAHEEALMLVRRGDNNGAASTRRAQGTVNASAVLEEDASSVEESDLEELSYVEEEDEEGSFEDDEEEDLSDQFELDPEWNLE
jgi:hypothetical protein